MSSHHYRRPSLNPLRHGVVAALLCFCGLGIAQGQTVVWSNLNEATSPSLSVGPSYASLRNVTDYAQSFTTGDTATTLVSITLSIKSVSVSDWDLDLLLFTDNSSLPGTLIETLSSSSDPKTGNNSYTSTGSTVLAANTSYWWVASAYSYNVASAYTFNMTTATPGESSDDWTIGEIYSVTFDRRRARQNWTRYNGEGSFQFEIVATPVPEPATTAALVGLITLGVAACSRRRRC
jgi:hypothetical protein